ncbi:MAG: L,D-transpeptidase [Chromatiales bacterium]
MTERIEIDLQAQALRLMEDGRVVRTYPVSTAARGAGEREGSGCTPRGLHRVRIKIGAGCPVNTVFIARRPTGELYSPGLAADHPQRDWILTRIIWLSGLEPGRNRGGGVDTLRRFIYIHGCPDSEPTGEARSHGCIRMRNADLLDLFDRVRQGTVVDIRECFPGHP